MNSEKMEDLPKVVKEGKIRICNYDLKCAVLSDGRRIFYKSSLDNFFEFVIKNNTYISQEEASKIVDFTNFGIMDD